MVGGAVISGAVLFTRMTLRCLMDRGFKKR